MVSSFSCSNSKPRKTNYCAVLIHIQAPVSDLPRSSLLGSLDGLKHTEARFLDVGNGLILLLLERLVLGLELLNLGLEGGLGILELLLAFGDLGIESGGVEGHGGLDLSLLGGVTEVEVLRSTGRSEVLLGESLEVLKGAATLVVFEVVRIAVLDGRIALDTVLAAEVLVDGAVNIGDESGLRVLEFLHELVPSRLHGFAVSSPRSEELDENGLAASHLVEVVRGELHSGGGDHEGEKKEGT